MNKRDDLKYIGIAEDTKFPNTSFIQIGCLSTGLNGHLISDYFKQANASYEFIGNTSILGYTEIYKR